MNALTQEKINEYIDYQIKKSPSRYHFDSSIKAEINRLNQLKQIVLKRQFTDITKNLNEAEYNKWLKQAKKTFLATIPTQSLLMGDMHHYPTHSDDELNEPIIGGLTSYEIIEILNSIDLYTILSLISNEVFILPVKPNSFIDNLGDICYVGDYGEKDELVTYPHREFRRSDSLYDGRQDFIDDAIRTINARNAYEVLYSKLGLPISTVLASINAVNTRFSCDLSHNDELCKRITKIQDNPPTPFTIGTRNYKRR